MRNATMNRRELVQLYDAAYARVYEEKFLCSEATRRDAEFEATVLSGLLSAAMSWLDVACGTGYFLSKFPQAVRAGLDVSPAMLEIARKANPGVPFREGDFRDDIPEWRDRWSLVSCMWYAYGLVDSMREIRSVFRNLAAWTSPEGTCFVPIVDARQISRVDLPNLVPNSTPGEIRIDAVVWSYIQDGGEKLHAHMIAPQLEVMLEIFRTNFADVELIRYPRPDPGRREEDCRAAILARRKKRS
jgi:SAM-dependent methyltransferase